MNNEYLIVKPFNIYMHVSQSSLSVFPWWKYKFISYMCKSQCWNLWKIWPTCDSVTEAYSTVWKPHIQSVASTDSFEMGIPALWLSFHWLVLNHLAIPHCKGHFRDVSQIGGRDIYYKIVNLSFVCVCVWWKIVIGSIVYPKRLSSNPQYLWISPYLEVGSLQI